MAEVAQTNSTGTDGSTDRRSIALIGFMGVGKTTVGRKLARRLGYRFVDCDMQIEMRTGMPVSKLFADQGEAAFRAIESEMVDSLTGEPRLVISTGGGIVTVASNTALVRERCTVVWLTAAPGILLARVGAADTRPLLAGAAEPLSRIRELLNSRAPLYRAAAHFVVDTTNRRPDAIAEEIARLCLPGMTIAALPQPPRE